jgi:hypothetical protein
MALRQAYSPIQPEFDDFLFATVGEEINGMPLSTISMLTRLGFDPWREAGRLASLATREATDQLTLILARLPGTDWVEERREEIAVKLIELLPKRVKTETTVGSRRSQGYWAIMINRVRPWLTGLILTAVVVITVVAQLGWPFGGR